MSIKPEAQGRRLIDARYFAPSSIVVVGASADPSRISGRPLAYLKRFGYAGHVFVVNPKHDDVQGFRAFESVADLPMTPDLALIVSPAETVPDYVRECGAKGIPYAVIVASGFVEVGNGSLNAALVSAIRDTGIRVTGPNCVGLLSAATKTTATFSSVLLDGWIREGGMSLVTQSGGLGNAVLQALGAMEVGLRTWVSSGNEVDLGFCDYVDGLLADPGTKAIAGFVEGFRPSDPIVAVGRRAVAARKPLVLLKAGRTPSGKASSLSHTGKLIGSGDVASAILRQARIAQVEDLDQLLDMLVMLDRIERPVAGGVGIVTVSGALGVLLSDAAENARLHLAKFDPQTQARLRELLPRYTAAAGNPLDVPLLHQEDVYAHCCNVVLDDPSVQALVVVISSLAHDYAVLLPNLESLASKAVRQGKILVVSYLSPVDRLPTELSRRLTKAHVPVIESPGRALSALGHTADLARWHAEEQRPEMRPPRSRIPASGPARTDFVQLLDEHHVPTVPTLRVISATEAVAAAKRLGYPVALKIDAEGVAHKTDVGGVRLHLSTPEEVSGAFGRLIENVRRLAPPNTVVSGAVVQPMFEGKLEALVGISVDPELGPVLVVGRGGIATEIDRDVSYRRLPVDEADIREMVSETKLSRLLSGYRGRSPYDLDALVRTALSLIDVYENEAWIIEIEANPVLIGSVGEGAHVADVLVSGDGLHHP